VWPVPTVARSKAGEARISSRGQVRQDRIGVELQNQVIDMSHHDPKSVRGLGKIDRHEPQVFQGRRVNRRR
jgi:hypothetical protein